MQEICINCGINESCLNKSPVNLRGNLPKDWHDCIRYSGKRLQDQAFIKHNQKLETFDTENGVIRGWKFGTPEQPTDKKTERFNRFVDTEGDVYIIDKRYDKVWQKTGQRIRLK